MRGRRGGVLDDEAVGRREVRVLVAPDVGGEVLRLGARGEGVGEGRAALGGSAGGAPRDGDLGEDGAGVVVG